MSRFPFRALALMILAWGLVAAGPAAAQLLPDDLTVDGRTASDTEKYVATGSVTVQNTTIQSGAEATAEAPNTIRLKPGFHAKTGSRFTATVGSTPDVTLTDLPPWTGNDRYLNSSFGAEHPALTLNGFDCENRCNEGLGLLQVLDAATDPTPAPAIKQVMNRIATLAKPRSQNGAYEDAPTTRSGIRQTTHAIQSWAFMALAAHVLEQNGYTQLGLRSSDAYMDDFETAVDDPSRWRVDRDIRSDAVKWTVTLSNMARAFDLYLALENAVAHYGSSAGLLLNETDKDDLATDYIQNVIALSEMGETARFFGHSAYSVQPGNWPLKVFTALGYSAYTVQMGGLPGNLDGSGAILQGYIDTALEASLQDAGTDRDHKFNYQTDDGRRFWAEGPYYFHYALEDVLPFWHASRISDKLNYNPDFEASDPFHDPTFLTPLHWLADVVTPEGFTPPTDAGNRHNMRFSTLMRWTDGYGESELGRKNAWIADRNGTFARSDDLLLVELAIPRLERGTGTPPVATLGNTTPSQTGESGEQQIIVRRSLAGRDHYLLMNGESGDAYGRGESHEQPDQMQLLYYIDGKSYLMDSGYDKGSISGGSWNGYSHHNVMVSDEVGLPSPGPHPGIRADIDKFPPDYLYRETHGSVDVLRGKQFLPDSYPLTDAGASYYRDVLFVNDPSSPYVIDFGGLVHNLSLLSNGGTQSARYHVYSNSATTNNFSLSNGEYIQWNDVDGSPDEVYLWPMPIEDVNATPVLTSDDARERTGSENTVSIQRFDLSTDIQEDQESYSVASVIQVSDSSPSSAPNLLWPSYASANYQGWYWWRDSKTIDFFIGHTQGSRANGNIRLELPDVDSSLPEWAIATSNDAQFGFMRIRKSDGTWSIDPNFQHNLGGGPLTLEAYVSGPTSLEDQQYGTWTASTDNADGPVSYSWSRRNCQTCSWFSVSETSDTYSGGFGNSGSTIQYAAVRVTASSGGESDTHSLTVGVLPSGTCGRLGVNGSTGTESKAICKSSQGLPQEYRFEKPSPHPVSGASTMELALPKATDVSLVVYDVMGRRVATLVNESLGAGFHTVQLDASRWQSGAYLYRLDAGSELQASGRFTVVR